MHHLIPEIARLCQHVTLGLSNWHAPLERLALLTGSKRAQLIGIGGPQVTPFNFVNTDDAAYFDDLLDIQGYRPDINFRIAVSEGVAEMQIADERNYTAVRPFLSTDIYNEYCEDKGIPFGCQTKLLDQGDRLIGLATLRTRAEGIMNADQRALFSEAAIHIRGAVDTQIKIEQQGKALMVGALEAISARAILIDGFGRVCGLTPGADALLTGGHRLTIEGQRLTSTIRPAAARIDRALAHILADPAPPGGIDIALPRTEQDRMPLLLSFKSLQPLAASLGLQPRAIVVIGGGLLAGDTLALRLRATFDLTEAEATIALALSQGQSRGEIAIARGVAIETLRSQIKTIFRKMDVGREGELVSLILGG